MKNTKKQLHKIEKGSELYKEFKNMECLYQICQNSPDIVLDTGSGVGRYHFSRIGYKDEELILEFKLVIDNAYKDSTQIMHNLGTKCYMTASQYLYSYNYNAKT